MKAIAIIILVILAILSGIWIALKFLRDKSRVSDTEKNIIKDTLKTNLQSLENIDNALKKNQNIKVNSIYDIIDTLP